MLKKLIEWYGPVNNITLGNYYDVDENDVFYDDRGAIRISLLGKWAEVGYEHGSEEHTGGSSSYYDIELGGSTIKCLDIIEALDMSYNEGNILKAVWRIAAAKQGKTKKGNNMHYDAEKIVFFGERLVEEHS